MVDALVLEASTSVCGFESHLPHQKKRAPKGAFFFWCQGIWLCQMPPAAAGTSASLHVWQEPAVPPHTPPPFFVIPYSLRSKRTAPATGRGLEPNCAPGFFLCPKFAPPPAKSKLTALPTGFPKTALPESMPQSSTPKLFTLHSSLFTLPALLLFPSGTDSKTKIYFVFFHLTHNSARYNIGLNLIMEGKEYGKTGSA